VEQQEETMSTSTKTESDNATAPAAAPAPEVTARPNIRTHWYHHWKLLTFLAVTIAGLALAIVYIKPVVETALDTISTDDAYVNGHATFVAPRVGGQVQRVLVDDNYRVKKGDLILELDPEPYQVQVNIKRAAVIAAETDLVATEAEVRATFAQLRSSRWKVQTAMEQVDNQIALLNARIATYRSKEATLERAKFDLGRAQDAYDKRAVSRQDLDAAIEAAKVAEALVKQSLEEVYEVRVSLGQPPHPANGNLSSLPPNLNQTFSTVRQALADLLRGAAQVGLPLGKAEATPKEVIDDFKSRDPQGDTDKVIAALIPKVPALKQAEAKLLQARRDLDQAELNLRYTRVYAEIDGVMTRRNVNPGNNIQAGQQVFAIRSLDEIWVDANFKETQLAELRIGQRVDVVADTYGAHRVFHGRITGFTYGTGSTLALLPPQNATGNFVKVVQRLPVRIELEDYDPDSDTLFAGLSVTPYVYYKDQAKGPNAGRRLQELGRPTTLLGGKK
jgi:membrane fusion protein (multidrug efflux system)